MNSGYGVLGLLIAGFLILDIGLGAAYFAGLARAKLRRRNFYLRNNQHYGSYGRPQHYGHHHTSIGRIGSLDDPDVLQNDNSQIAYQRSA